MVTHTSQLIKHFFFLTPVLKQFTLRAEMLGLILFSFPPSPIPPSAILTDKTPKFTTSLS